MAQADRHYTGDVTVFTVGTFSMLAMFKNATINVSVTTQENRAAKDDWEYNVGRISKWSISFPKTVENEGTAANLWTLFNTGVVIAMTLASSAKKGIALGGTARLTEIARELADIDGQTDTITLVGMGALTITTVT